MLLAAIAVPAHAFALKGPWPAAPPAPAHAGGGVSAIARSRPFWMLACALTLSAFTVYAVVVDLVPLLLERGFTSQAAWALGLGGAGQTLGRTLCSPLTRHSTTGTKPQARALRRLKGTSTSLFETGAVCCPGTHSRHPCHLGDHDHRPHPRAKPSPAAWWMRRSRLSAEESAKHAALSSTSPRGPDRARFRCAVVPIDPCTRSPAAQPEGMAAPISLATSIALKD